MKSFLYTLGFVLFAIPMSVSAQTFMPFDAGTLEIKMSPVHPKPGQTVTLSLSGGESLDRALITWSVDNQQAAQGEGERTFVFSAGAIGTATIIAVDAQGPERTESAEIVVRPSRISIIWEAMDSYTAPFYLGKALPAVNTAIRLVAVPEFTDESGGTYAPEEIIYVWKENGKVISRGKGKYMLDTAVSRIPGASRTFTVEAETADYLIANFNSITLTPALTETVVYEESPLLGVRFDRAIEGSLVLPVGETTLLAFPFFFGASTRDAAALSYAWQIRSGFSSFDQRGPGITLSPERNSANRAVASLNLTTTHETQFLQRDTLGFSLTFDPQAR